MDFYIQRFKGMERKEFEIEVITPMFLGGADKNGAELRAASIKGAMRFWWRALYGSDDLQDMKKREAAIFGTTTQKSSFSVRLKNTDKIKPILEDLPQGIKVKTQAKGKTFSISIIEYLAYGLYDWNRQQRKNVYTKEHFPVGSKFKLVLTIGISSFKDQIVNSLIVLSEYGGLGSRSRNGFGSIRVNGGFSRKIEMAGEPKSFTSFNSRSIIFSRFKQEDSWDKALSAVGKVYREARMSLEKKHSFEKRPLIAKPLIVKGEVKIEDRHAKPYFFHVSKLPDGKYQGQILFLPYNYHIQSDRKKYIEVCDRMNRKIEELSGGSK